MKLDLSALENAIASLEASSAVVGNRAWFAAQSQAVQDTLIAGVIQNFEFVYELAVKMIRRRIEVDAATPTEADFADFRDLMRSAAERGLIADVEAWFGYRKLRNVTAHTYDREKARQVYQGLSPFLSEARALLRNLEARNV